MIRRKKLFTVSVGLLVLVMVTAGLYHGVSWRHQGQVTEEGLRAGVLQFLEGSGRNFDPADLGIRDHLNEFNILSSIRTERLRRIGDSVSGKFFVGDLSTQTIQIEIPTSMRSSYILDGRFQILAGGTVEVSINHCSHILE